MGYNMTSLYDKAYNLFHQWLSTTDEDFEEFCEWISHKYLFLSDRLHFPSILYKNYNTNNLHNPQGAIITTTNDYIQITTNTSSEKKVNIPTEWLANDKNAFIEWTYVNGGAVQPIAFSINGSNNTAVGGWFSYNGSTLSFSLGTSTTLSRTINSGDKILVARYNGYTEVYHNRELIHRTSMSISADYRFGFYTNNGRVQRLKDIRVGTL